MKPLRAGKTSLQSSYVQFDGEQLFLYNLAIEENNKKFGGDKSRPRKLLLKKKELSRLLRFLEGSGRTIIPTKIYFNERGIAKVEIALSTGRKKQDKRQLIKDRDWKREKAREFKNRNL